MTEETGDNMDAIISDAYAAFKFPRPDDPGVCTECCMDPDMAKHFFDAGQRDIPHHYIREWFSAAKEVPMRKGIWGWILPRTLEMLAHRQEPSNVGIETVFSCYDTGNPDNWNMAQWKVLDRFQRHFLTNHRSYHPDYLDDVICAFARGGWKIDDLWQQVLAMPDETLAEIFWNDWIGPRYGHDVWIDAFWENKDEMQAMLRRYTDPELAERMTRFGVSANGTQELRDMALQVATVMEDKRPRD